MDFDENIEEQGDHQGGDFNIQDELLLIEEDTHAQYKSMKDCVIFLLDCNKTMIENNAINKVLSVCESFLKTKIITNERDIFGLITYNSEITVNNFNFLGINVKIPLAPPDAGLIKNIKLLQKCTNPSIEANYSHFLKENFPTSNFEISLSSALTVCHSELKNFDEKSHNKRIFLFTDNDSPMLSNLSDRNITIQRAKDMLESDIIIELFPMNFTHSFNMRKFYSDIIPMTVNSNEDLILSKENCEDRIRELTKRIRQKEVKKRTLGKCHLFLTKDVKFMVNFYATVKKTAKPRSHNVDARTNKPLNTITQSICKETAGILYQNQIGTFQAYGGAKVPFTKDEMKQIKTLDAPGIKLMGFKSFDSIKPYYNIRESYFLYPDEYLTSGASQLCDALIKQMLNKNKVAVVKFIPREGANIRFCALVPQKEAFDEDYFQTPPGFNLIFLPYADEIRSNSDILKKVKNLNEMKSVQESITQEQMNCAKRLVKKMNIEFDSRNFENPTIQKFYATLQALALGEADVEAVEDYINPNNEALSRVLNDCDEDFKNLFWGKSANKTYVAPIKKEVKPRKRKGDEGEVSSHVSNDASSELNVKSFKRGKKGNEGMIVDDSSSIRDFMASDEESSRSNNNIKKATGKNKIKEEDEDEDDQPSTSNVVNSSNNIIINTSITKGDKNKSGKKKGKQDDGDDLSEKRLLNLLENGILVKKTVKELRTICTEKKILVSAKATKNDMVYAIQEFLFSQLK